MFSAFSLRQGPRHERPHAPPLALGSQDPLLRPTSLPECSPDELAKPRCSVQLLFTPHTTVYICFATLYFSGNFPILSTFPNLSV